jgi:antirestriction protein
MLTGTTLLNKVNEMQAQNPPAKMSEIVRACGYEHDGKLHQTLCESYGKDAVNAFLEIYDDESNLQYFEDAYQGRYDSESDFAEQFTTDVYGFDAPSFVVVDWDATWNCNLRYDFDFEDGFVFNKNF